MERSFSIRSLLSNGKTPKQLLSLKSNINIVVEGNIGIGKSTFLSHFEDCGNDVIETICEPVEKWTNVQGHNALALLYEDPQRWNFSFNMFAMLTRVKIHTRPHVKPVKMLERSLHCTKHCFIENSYANNGITHCEYSILDQWYNFLSSDENMNIDLIIYLRAAPDVCYERLKKRLRKEEVGVPKNLLTSLHTLHDDWLLHKKYPLPAPVFVLDANPNLIAMKEKYDQIYQEIFEFINN